MKTTIIISLLIICSVCKGQGIGYCPVNITYDLGTVISGTGNMHGIVIHFSKVFKCIDTAFKIPAFLATNSYTTSPQTVYDTVKVEMIVTNSDPLKNQVVKIIGYEVVQTGYHIYDPTYPQYLDILKQPLSKDLTIWMAKGIK